MSRQDRDRVRASAVLALARVPPALPAAAYPCRARAPLWLQIPDEWEGYDLNLFSIPNHYRDDLDKILLPSGIIHDR